MPLWIYTVLPVLLAGVAVSLVMPKLVLVAVRKSIVDNPCARKLNKEPVPVLGGVGVFFGIFFAVGLMGFAADCSPLFMLFIALFMMLSVGVIDDILGLSPRLRLMVELLAVCLVMFYSGMRIDNLHGLWNVWAIPGWISYPLTVVACVGVINAINLIDGVDGLSSGYGMLASMLCGIVFLLAGDYPFAILAFATVGALFPFFMHNVFGRKYKMFIGDGGTLVLGFVLAAFIVRILEENRLALYYNGLVSFTLAVFAVPVFDTLRVMATRIGAGRSPFAPDKNHLHHLFIDLGCSHAGTTLIILSLNLLVVLVWLLTEVLGMRQGVQLAVVLASCLAVTWGIWFGVEFYRRRNPEGYARLGERIGSRRMRRDGIFLRIQQMLDNL